MNSVRRTPTPSLILLLRTFSTRKSKSLSPSPPKPSDTPFHPKPPNIPFQPKIANSVNIIGEVHSPVQFQTSPDGNAWASTVITRPDSPSSPSLEIPVIFEGDLAHTAFSHLKPHDFIHVAGQLSTHPPHLLTKFQVMVQSLNFVQGYPQLKDAPSTHTVFPISTNEERDISRKHIDSKQNEEHNIDKSWKDLLHDPSEWWDVRSTKENPKGAAFERKTSGELLFINSSTPKWLQEKLDSMTFDVKPEPKHSISIHVIAGAKKSPNSPLSSWSELLDDPKEWRDFRDCKVNGLVNPRHPDFKRKDGKGSLWLNRAPTWVLSKLEGLEFDVPAGKSKQTKEFKGEQSWNDLVQNPAKWWDNRSNKRNERAPDFKHKETGEVLWLKGSPSWVLSKLEGLEFDVPAGKSKQTKEFKGEQSWNDLVQNPAKWWDNRSNKRNERAPDFKHKETGEVLWLKGSPSWLLSKLPPLKPK